MPIETYLYEWHTSRSAVMEGSSELRSRMHTLVGKALENCRQQYSNSDLNSVLIPLFFADIVNSGFRLRDAIERRKTGTLDTDNGSRYGWVQQLGKLPSSGIDSDAEIVYLHLPNALTSEESVRYFFMPYLSGRSNKFIF